MRSLNVIALALVIIGGINWLLVGAANFNLVAAIFGDQTTVSRIVYVIVGLAALYCLSLFGVLGRPHTALNAQYAGNRPLDR